MKYKTTVKNKLCNASICEEKEIASIKKEIKKVDFLEEITTFSKVLGDTTRGKIVHLLYKYEALCVCDIANILDISIASASQHLRKMTFMGLVDSHKKGTTVFYMISDKSFRLFLHTLYTPYEKK